MAAAIQKKQDQEIAKEREYEAHKFALESRDHARVEWSRGDIRWGWANEDRQKELANKKAAESGASYGVEHDNLDPEYLVSNHIVDREHLVPFIQSANFVRDYQGNSKEGAIRDSQVLDRLHGREIGKPEWDDMYRKGQMTPSAYAEGVKWINSADSEWTNARVSVEQSMKSQYLSFIVGADVDKNGIMNQLVNGVNPKSKVLSDAFKTLPDFMAGFGAAVDAYKAQTNKTDAQISKSELLQLSNKYLADNMMNKATELQEKYKSEMEDTNGSKYNSFAKTVAPVEEFNSNDPALQILRQRQEALYRSSLSALTTIFGDTPAPASDMNKLGSVYDILNYGNSHTTGGLSWQESFFILNGMRPESVGVETARQAELYTHNNLSNLGYKVPEARTMRTSPDKKVE